MMEIRQATPADATLFGLGHLTLRAHVAVVEGEPAAIAGTYLGQAYVIGFSTIRRPMSKKDILRFARFCIGHIRSRRQTIVVIRNTEYENSDRFLRWLGFEKLDRTSEGDAYIMRAGG